MEKYHFSVHDLIEIMTLTMCLIYLLQIVLIKLIPPKSTKYFALHLGLLLLVMLFFIIKGILVESNYLLFFVLFLVIICCTNFLLKFYLNGGRLNIFVKLELNKPAIRAVIIGEVGFALFLSAWLTLYMYAPTADLSQPIFDPFLILLFYVLLSIQGLYYSHNEMKPEVQNIQANYDWISHYQNVALGWNRILVFGYAGLAILIVTTMVLEKMTFSGLPYVAVITYITSIGIYMGGRKKTQSKRKSESQEEQELKSNFLTQDKRETYIYLKNELIQLMLEEQLYLNKAITIHDIASRLNTNNKYLSETVNILLDQSFVTFVNEYRIEHAKRLLKNPENNHYTLETIGELSGFNSKSSFNSVFKKTEKVTPSIYKLNHQKNSYNPLNEL
ncbi:MAG: AraC-like DNA-binding protein [Crocinitomix sp.]|jgi:AraC-like DNA-binding protein